MSDNRLSIVSKYAFQDVAGHKPAPDLKVILDVLRVKKDGLLSYCHTTGSRSAGCDARSLTQYQPPARCIYQTLAYVSINDTVECGFFAICLRWRICRCCLEWNTESPYKWRSDECSTVRESSDKPISSHVCLWCSSFPYSLHALQLFFDGNSLSIATYL